MELRLLGPMTLIARRAAGAAARVEEDARLARLSGGAATGRCGASDCASCSGKCPTIPRARCAGASASCAGVLGDAIVADRESAGARPSPDSTWIGVDLRERGAARTSRTDAVEALEALARLRGEFLEGLELAALRQISAPGWIADARGCAPVAGGGLRETGRPRHRARPRAATGARLDRARSVRPGCAASRWSTCSMRPGGAPRPTQQRALGIRRLSEGGVPVPAAIAPAGRRRPPPGARAPLRSSMSASARRATAPASPIRWSARGRRWSRRPTGSTISNIDFDSPVWRHWIEALLQRCARVVRYDERGNGLSDWNAPLTFEAFVDDLESVVDAAGLDRFDLLGISQGASVAIAYAVRHPERVRRLPLWAAMRRDGAIRAAPGEIERREAMLDADPRGLGTGQSRLSPDVHLALPARSHARAMASGSTKCSA